MEMQPNTQFKINSVEELKQAYNNSSRPLGNINNEIKKYKKGYRYWQCDFDNDEYLFEKNKYHKIITNPFKSEYPKEMLVWNDCSKNETKILTVFGVFKGQYITTHAGHFIGYDNATDIEPKPKTIKEKIKELQKIIEETQIALKQLKN